MGLMGLGMEGVGRILSCPGSEISFSLSLYDGWMDG